MKKRIQCFPTDSIIVIAEGDSFRDAREPPHWIGNIVRLNSGGPPCLIVDIDGDNVTIAWHRLDGSSEEMTLPDLCVHRVRSPI